MTLLPGTFYENIKYQKCLENFVVTGLLLVKYCNLHPCRILVKFWEHVANYLLCTILFKSHDFFRLNCVSVFFTSAGRQKLSERSKHQDVFWQTWQPQGEIISKFCILKCHPFHMLITSGSSYFKASWLWQVCHKTQ